MSCHEFTLPQTKDEEGRKTAKRGVLHSLTLLFPLLLSHLIELTLGHLRYLKEEEKRRKEAKKPAAPKGVPERSPNSVLTGPCVG
jgi:hypothetical protein